VAAIERLRMSGVPFVSILTDPTTGGVFASFAVIGDINVAEPNALIGFAGARVSAGTIAQELPPGFQRSEFLYAHGFLDRVVHRTELRAEIASLLAFLVARPLPLTIEETTGDVLGLPSFRPLSFLSNLAERVMQTEAEPAMPTNGNGSNPPASSDSVTAAPPGSTDDGTEASSSSGRSAKAGRQARTTEAPRPTAAEMTAIADTPENTEPEQPAQPEQAAVVEPPTTEEAPRG
jgi:hypothetical protein